MAHSNNSVVWKEGFTPRKDPKEAKKDFQLHKKNSQMSADFARKREDHGKKEG